MKHTHFLTRRIHAIALIVRPLYESIQDPGHEWNHVLRVTHWATRLAESEGASGELVQAAALLHDLVNVPKNSPDRALASELAAEEAKKYLSDFTDDEIKTISTAILEHSFSRGLKPSTLEAACLQDADRLDALGAIGMMRLVACGTLMKSRFFDQNEPFQALEINRKLDDRKWMIDHFYIKLLKLEESISTNAGKIEAKRRTQYLKDFLKQLESEVSGLN